jgi:hypothetical protein
MDGCVMGVCWIQREKFLFLLVTPAGGCCFWKILYCAFSGSVVKKLFFEKRLWPYLLVPGKTGAGKP